VAQWTSVEERRVKLERLKLTWANMDLQNLGPNTGISLSEIDHVILGVHADEKAFPRLTLVVQTRQPYDLGHVRIALGAKAASSKNRKNLYSYSFKELIVWQPVFWCADERTLVFSLSAKDLEKVPQDPLPGVDRFIEPIRTRLEHDLEPSTLLWVVGYAPRWDEILGKLMAQLQASLSIPTFRPPPILMSLAHFPDEGKQHLKPIQGFAVGLEPSKDRSRATARLDCSDEDGAAEVDAYAASLTGERQLLHNAVHRVEDKTVHLEIPLSGSK
jgi:hypothetical protein